MSGATSFGLWGSLREPETNDRLMQTVRDKRAKVLANLGDLDQIQPQTVALMLIRGVKVYPDGSERITLIFGSRGR